MAGRRAAADRRQVAGRSRTSTSPISPRAASPRPTQPDGRIDSLPLNLDPWVVYYNKELFDAKNIAYPKTSPRWSTPPRKLNDPAKGVCGFVGRGLKNANVPVWTSFLLGYGGGFVDANGKLMTETRRPPSTRAKMYQTLLAKYGPQGVAGFNWNESQSLFVQGKAAMWLDGIGFAAPLEDPTKSRIVGKVGYGVMPAGPEAAGVGAVRRRRGHLGLQQEEGPGLVLPAVGVEQDEPDAHAAGRRRRAGAQLGLRRCAQASADFKSPQGSGSSAW